MFVKKLETVGRCLKKKRSAGLFIFLNKKVSRSRLELETVCVLDRRDNHLHQRDLLDAKVVFKYLEQINKNLIFGRLTSKFEDSLLYLELNLLSQFYYHQSTCASKMPL